MRVSASSPGHDARDVVVEDEHHQREKQEETDLLRHFPLAKGQRPSAHGFEREEQQMAAVEHRNRQEIEHAQVHADEPEETDEIVESALGLLARGLDDEDRTAEIAR